MPIDLLDQLADIPLPAIVSEPEQIHRLRALVAAGHVYATVPLPYCGMEGQWCQEPAVVHAITPLGYKVLRYFGSASKSASIDKDRGS